MFTVIGSITLTLITFFVVPPPAPPQDASAQTECSEPVVADADGNPTSAPCDSGVASSVP